MKFVLFTTAATVAFAANSSFCGDWKQLLVGSKCVTNTKCCLNQDTGSPPSCVSPLNPDTTSLVSEESYVFAGDGTYAATFMVATGNSCPLTYTSGTLIFVVDTKGTYTIQGDNTDIGNGWQKIVYTPKTFIATVAKSNQASPINAGQTVGPDILAPCLKMDAYLNDIDYGCPCNGTWTTGGISTGTSAANTRSINVSSCPLVNGNSSCPESFFFNRADRYGNIKVHNDTNNTMRILEVTQPNLNSTEGYNSSTVYSTYSANFTCPSVTSPTPASSSAGALTVSALFASVLALAAMF